MKELKPVTFIQGRYLFNRQNDFQQKLMLRALLVTQDPKKLREMVGLKTMAEVYRTLDKMAMRKEFHEALARLGISFDFIVEGIKKEAVDGYKSSDRLNAFKTLLKSLGMDKYEEKQVSGGSWEDVLLKALDAEVVVPRIEAPADYLVVEPTVPESARKMREKEDAEGKGLYE